MPSSYFTDTVNGLKHWYKKKSLEPPTKCRKREVEEGRGRNKKTNSTHCLLAAFLVEKTVVYCYEEMPWEWQFFN